MSKVQKPYVRLSPINEAKVIQVIEIKSIIGEGTPESPIEEITEYYSQDGERLARRTMETNLENGIWNEL